VIEVSARASRLAQKAESNTRAPSVACPGEAHIKRVAFWVLGELHQLGEEEGAWWVWVTPLKPDLATMMKLSPPIMAMWVEIREPS